jgi:hypothetical protein
VVDEADMVKDTGKACSGGLLMKGGMNFERMWGDYRAKVIYLEA